MEAFAALEEKLFAKINSAVFWHVINVQRIQKKKVWL